jgi:hypothetical protein
MADAEAVELMYHARTSARVLITVKRIFFIEVSFVSRRS